MPLLQQGQLLLFQVQYINLRTDCRGQGHRVTAGNPCTQHNDTPRVCAVDPAE